MNSSEEEQGIPYSSPPSPMTCECLEWASDRLSLTILGNGHHYRCRHFSADPMVDIISELVKGIDWWASQEDGVPDELWAAYAKAKRGLNPAWVEPESKTPPPPPPCEHLSFTLMNGTEHYVCDHCGATKKVSQYSDSIYEWEAPNARPRCISRS